MRADDATRASWASRTAMSLSSCLAWVFVGLADFVALSLFAGLPGFELCPAFGAASADWARASSRSEEASDQVVMLMQPTRSPERGSSTGTAAQV